jgi:hypothetical protein
VAQGEGPEFRKKKKEKTHRNEENENLRSERDRICLLFFLKFILRSFLLGSWLTFICWGWLDYLIAVFSL